jgi:hypothetical protein
MNLWTTWGLSQSFTLGLLQKYAQTMHAKEGWLSQALVTHVYNPSYLGG